MTLFKLEKPPNRKLVVLVNPFSGTGEGMRVWKQVKPLFKIANIDVERIETTHQGHAEEYSQAIPLEHIKDGIVCISGDGLVSEVLNGFMKRRDWEQAMDIPIGIIPSGSGNGLTKSLGLDNPIYATFAIINRNTTKLDVFSIISNNQRRFGCLSVSWGLMAAIDFKSEILRFTGKSRFSIWAVNEIIKKSTYSGDIYYYPHDAPDRDELKILDEMANTQENELEDSKLEKNNEPTDDNDLNTQLPNGHESHKDNHQHTIEKKSIHDEKDKEKSKMNGHLDVNTLPQDSKKKGTSEKGSRAVDGDIEGVYVEDMNGQVEQDEKEDPDEIVDEIVVEEDAKTGLKEDDSIEHEVVDVDIKDSSDRDSLNRSGNENDERALTKDINDHPEDIEAGVYDDSQLDAFDILSTSPSRNLETVCGPATYATLPRTNITMSHSTIGNVSNGPPLYYIPFDMDNINHWRGISGNIMFFLASNVTHIATSTKVAPHAVHSDGLMDLIIVRKASRSDLLKILLGLEKGTHIQNDLVEYIKVKSFTLKTNVNNKDHWMMGIDGEMIESDYIQVEMHKKMMTVFIK